MSWIGIPRNEKTAGHDSAYPVAAVLGKQRRGDPRSSLASQSELMSSGFRERSCHKNKMESDGGGHWVLTPCLHVCVHRYSLLLQDKLEARCDRDGGLNRKDKQPREWLCRLKSFKISCRELGPDRGQKDNAGTWIWEACRSMVMMWSAPATDSMLATSLAEIGARL